MTSDAHRHLGVLPAYPFYGGPPVRPDIGAPATIKQLITNMDAEGTERALVIPNYGVPDPAVAFGFNQMCVEAAQADDRIRAALWVSPLPRDTEALRVLARHNRVVPMDGSGPEPCAGVYAQVLRPGRISVGDVVQVA